MERDPYSITGNPGPDKTAIAAYVTGRLVSLLLSSQGGKV
jgi:hypothetical protein